MKRIIIMGIIVLGTVLPSRGQVKEINEDQWDDVDLTRRPVVVDVYAPWCAPCKTYAPIVAKAASEFAGKVDFYRINGDKYEDFTEQYGVGAYPTTLFFYSPYPDGRWSEVGLLDFNELEYNIGLALERFEQENAVPAESLFQEAMDYATGENGKPYDLHKALQYMHRAAIKDYTEAQYMLGVLYESMELRDPVRSAYWYGEAAKKGHSDAQCKYGYLLYCGYYGLDRSAEEAAYWWTKSAEQGNSAAQYNLGQSYYDGDGVKRDLEKAKYWLKKAADQGNEDAERELKAYNLE